MRATAHPTGPTTEPTRPHARQLAAPRPAVLAAALALLGTCAPTQAQVRSGASLSDLRYTLTDLVPGDASAPAIMPTSAPRGSLSEFLLVQAPGLPTQNLQVDKDQLRPGAVGTQDGPLAHGGVGYLGTGGIAAITLSTSAGGQGFAEQITGGVQTFRLAPHTAVTYFADAAADVTLDTGSLAPQHADATLLLTVGPVIGGSTNVPANLLLTDRLVPGVDNLPYFHGPNTLFSERTLSVTWQNTGNDWEDAFVGFTVAAGASFLDGEVSPVPEPSAWAMCAAGCTLLGWRVRRKA